MLVSSICPSVLSSSNINSQAIPTVRSDSYFPCWFYYYRSLGRKIQCNQSLQGYLYNMYVFKPSQLTYAHEHCPNNSVPKASGHQPSSLVPSLSLAFPTLKYSSKTPLACSETRAMGGEQTRIFPLHLTDQKRKPFHSATSSPLMTTIQLYARTAAP